MADNVFPMPRPRVVRPAPEPLGLYVRAGRIDHVELLNLFAAGDAECFGVVFNTPGINWADDAMAKKMRAHRKRLDNLRIAFGRYAEANPSRSFASVPLRRAVREAQGRHA